MTLQTASTPAMPVLSPQQLLHCAGRMAGMGTRHLTCILAQAWSQ